LLLLPLGAPLTEKTTTTSQTKRNETKKKATGKPERKKKQ